MAVSCAVHHSAKRFCFGAAVQTVDFFNMSDDLQWSNTLLSHLLYMLHQHPRSRMWLLHLRTSFVASDDRVRGTRTCISWNLPSLLSEVPTGAVIEKTVEFPVVQSAQSTRTLLSLETVPVCEMRLVVTVEMVEVESLLPAVPVSPLSMTAPVVDVPLVMLEQRVDELNIENSLG